MITEYELHPKIENDPCEALIENLADHLEIGDTLIVFSVYPTHYMIRKDTSTDHWIGYTTEDTSSYVPFCVAATRNEAIVTMVMRALSSDEDAFTYMMAHYGKQHVT